MLLLLFKTCLLCVFGITVRGSLPRYRIDQLITINWKTILYILLFLLFFYLTSLYLLNFLYL